MAVSKSIASVCFLIVAQLGIATVEAASSGVAIDVTASSDLRLSNKNSVTTTTFSTAQANELVLAFVAAGDKSAGNAVTAVSGAGLTWDLVVRTNAERGTAEIWRSFAKAPLHKAAVTAILLQKAPASITVVTFTGVDASGTNGAGAIGAIASAHAATGAPNATLTTTGNNSWVFGVGSDWDTATSRTLDAGQTMVHQFLASTAADTYWVQRATNTTATSGTRVTLDDVAPTQDRYNLSLCEIRSAPEVSDIAPPTVTMTAPTQSTVSDTVLVSASAADDVGVAGVQFLLDDAPLGPEVTTGSSGSYSTTWATTAATNGTHALSAVARDASGKTAKALPLTVTVDNVVPPPPPTRDRANSYDDAWEAAWVNHARSLLATAPGKTDGFVLEIGDSITHSYAYAMWPVQGEGKTTDDGLAIAWARAMSWSNGNFDVTNKNGWYLADADTTAQRGMTSSGGLSTGELVSGCCNGGPTMPIGTSQANSAQIVADPTYTGNLQIDTLISAFSDAQFAVVMLGTNDPGSATNVMDLTTIVDKLEAQHIVPILSTIPPRDDSFSNQFNIDFNAAVTKLAEERSLPLIDFYQEILLRRPGTTWIGTLISSDGVHPTASGAGFTADSDPYLPGGDPATHTTGDAPANVGYLLRSWLVVQKLLEVKQYVIDGINPQ